MGICKSSNQVDFEEVVTQPTQIPRPTSTSLDDARPLEFGIFLNYACALQFDDKPDYSYLRKLFRDLFTREALRVTSTTMSSTGVFSVEANECSQYSAALCFKLQASCVASAVQFPY
jgi:hypothetical protein